MVILKGSLIEENKNSVLNVLIIIMFVWVKLISCSML